LQDTTPFCPFHPSGIVTDELTRVCEEALASQTNEALPSSGELVEALKLPVETVQPALPFSAPGFFPKSRFLTGISARSVSVRADQASAEGRRRARSNIFGRRFFIVLSSVEA
jgi:hypothetical protein